MSLTRLDVLVWLSTKRARLFLSCAIVFFFAVVGYVLSDRVNASAKMVDREVTALRKNLNELQLRIDFLNKAWKEARDKSIEVTEEETGRGFDKLSARIDGIKFPESKAIESR